MFLYFENISENFRKKTIYDFPVDLKAQFEVNAMYRL